MNIIVAVDRNWAIGIGGKQPFSFPEDRKFLRRVTKGKALVMGQRTFESLPGGKPLPDRPHIVLSDDEAFSPEGVTVCRSLAELKAALQAYASGDVFVFGGQAVYEELLPYCKYAYITKYDRAYEADRFFPDLDAKEDWKFKETLADGSYEEHAYRMCLYENAAVRPF
jgi:dihydrofolate reductase